jgi:arginine repressor
VKEAVFALAPTLERMKKRGFDTQEVAQKLHEKGIVVKAPTLAKYLAEFRRQRERKPDRPAPSKPEVKVEVSQQVQTPESIVIRPDTPDDEL